MPREPKRSRLDTEVNIFDQLTSVFEEITAPSSAGKSDSAAETITVDGDVTIVHIADNTDEMKVFAGLIAVPTFPTFLKVFLLFSYFFKKAPTIPTF